MSLPLRRSLGRVAPAAAAALAAVFAAGAGAQPGPVLDCATAKALSRLPAKPVWFPVPQPEDVRPAVNVAAPPKFVRGVKWDWGDRYFWLARMPRGVKLGDRKAKVVAELRFGNLGRTIRVLRLSDRRLYAQWPTAKGRRDTTVVVSKNHTTTEVGFFLASLKKVRWPARCR